jgi:hypothetical protein
MLRKKNIYQKQTSFQGHATERSAFKIMTGGLDFPGWFKNTLKFWLHNRNVIIIFIKP